MKNKYLLMVLLGLGFTVTSLVGCGNTDDPGGDEDDEVVTLTFFNADGSLDMKFDDEVAAEITRLTGVRLDITAPLAGDEAQDIALMNAGNEFPDLIYAKGSLDLLIGADAVIPLDDLIEERGDQIKAMYGNQLGRLRHTLENPAIYHVGTFGVNDLILETSGTAQIQMDVMRKLGYPTLQTLADFENAIKAYIKENPTINGQDTIGLSLLGSDWRWLITVGNPAGFALGLQDDGEWSIEEETGEAIFKYLMPEFREYFRWLNGMNAQGLLDPESFTHTPDTYFAKLSSGRVLAVMDQGWNMAETQTALVAEGEEWRTFMPLGVTLAEETTLQVTRDNGYTGGWGISIAANSEKVEIAFDFLEWMASEEAQILVNWGIEGVHWEYVDGQRAFFPEVAAARQTNPKFDLETGVGLYVEPFPMWGTATVDSQGQPISPDTEENMIANYHDAQRETLAAYGVDLFVELFPTPEALGISRHGAAWALPVPTNTDLALIQQRADDFVQQAVTQAVLVPPVDFDEMWDAVIDGLNQLNIEAANAEMTKIVQDTIELWERE